MNIELSQEHHNIDISGDFSTYHLPIASTTTLGGVKVGNNLSITSDGTLSATSTEYELPAATSSILGGVKVGSGLSMSITDVLSVTVDSTLSSSSTNPLQNKVIYSNLNAINNDITALDNRLTDDETTIGNHTSALSTISGTVDQLSDDLDTLSSTVSTNTSNISANALNISTNTTDIGLLDGRLTSAEDSISDLGNSVDTMAGQINDVIRSTDTTVEYTSLLPVATWTDGELILRRRGYLGFLFLNLEGNFLLGANSSTTIYTFQTASNIPTYETSASVLTDVGNIVLSVDDQGVVKLTNPSASALTISKVYGNVPLVY